MSNLAAAGSVIARLSLLFGLILWGGASVAAAQVPGLQGSGNVAGLGFVSKGNIWPQQTIRVCWDVSKSDFAKFAQERAWVRDAIWETWEAHSGVQFIGWQRYDINRDQNSIRIVIEDVGPKDGPHTKGLGTRLRGKAAGMSLNFTFQKWNANVKGDHQSRIRSIAVHEFGHALGFAHEQNRPDTPWPCQAQRQGGDGDITVGAWDLESIMNYCNPTYNGDGFLSPTDILTVQQFYGRPKFRTGTVGVLTEPENRTTLISQRPQGSVFTKFFPDPAKRGNWSKWLPLDDNTFPSYAPLTTIRARPGETSLYVVGHDGRVWSKFFPEGGRPKWSAWFPLGDNVFPLRSPVTAVSTGPGMTSLYVVGKDGQIWTKYFPAQNNPSAWSEWIQLSNGTEQIPIGTRITALSLSPGATSLYFTANDGRVYTQFFPDSARRNGWSPMLPLGDETFPMRAPITAISVRPGETSLYNVGHDGRVYTKFFPDAGQPRWSGWLPLKDQVFPAGAPVAAVSTSPGATSLYIIGEDGRMMSSYFPAAGNNWSDWFPLGDNKFPKEAQVSAVSTGVNATSLYVVGLDQAVWSKFFPANDGKWSDWFSLDKLPSPILQVDATKVERHQTGAYITVRGKEFTPGALVDITVEGLVNVPKGQYAGTGQVRLDGTFQAIVDARLHSGQTGAATLRVTDSVSGDSVTTSTTAYSSPR